jgi:hypothetical protein
MANIWSCSASVSLKDPIKNVQGFRPDQTEITMSVKCRTESEREPSDAAILKQARHAVETCYDVVVLAVHHPCTNFLLWEHI